MPLRDIPRIDERQPWPTIAISAREREIIATPAPTSARGKSTHPPRRNTAPGRPTHPQAVPTVQTPGGGQVVPLPVPTPAGGGALVGWLTAFPKGALIGATLFALYYGFFLNRTFWLVDWHWAYVVGGMVVATILIRIDRMLIVLMAVGLWYSRATLLGAPELFAVWIAGGIIGRLLYEALP